MKHNLFVLLSAFALSISLAGPVHARESVVALSPFGSPEGQMKLIEQVAMYLAASVEPGENAYLIDAWNKRLIATFSVPNNSAYKNPRAKLKANRTALRSAAAFAKAARGGAEEGAIDLPGTLRFVGSSYPAKTERDLIIIGSPLHQDPKSPSSDMAAGAVPNDDHIAASRAHSTFGAADEKGRLENYSAYFGAPNGDWVISDRHAYAVEQYVSLSISQRGATLVTFSSNPATPFEDAAAEASLPVGDREAVFSGKLEMVTFAPEDTPLGSIYEREISRDRPRISMLRRADQVEIGIRWNQCPSCDLDLMAKPDPNAATISYKNPVSTEGRLYKDYLRSPARNGFETIAFGVPVDLTKLRLAVNLFNGKPGDQGVTGEIRIAIGPRTWAGEFTIPAKHGNGGAGEEATVKDGKPANSAWVVINPLAITGRR